MAKQTYPETALLKQVKGVGDLIATAYVLTIEDPHRFRKSRGSGDVAADLGAGADRVVLGLRARNVWRREKGRNGV
jgi:hypothetical protein